MRLLTSTVCCLFFVLLIQFLTDEADARNKNRLQSNLQRSYSPPSWTYRLYRRDTGVCVYKGYKPGGGVPNIQPIQPPICKGFSNSLGFISGVLGVSAGAGRALSQVATLIATTAKVAKVLSAGFGVFAAAFAIVSFASKPTPNDILKKVDDTFAKLTKDMNDRLQKMEGYVDAQVIKVEQTFVKNEFAVLKRYFANCIVQETTEYSVRQCQQNSIRDMDAAWPKFQRLKTQFASNAKDISLYDIKRLEASLIPFRDYASLHLYALQLLANSYKSDPDSAEKNKRLKIYLDIIKKRSDMYVKYAKWAYGRIYVEQVGKHYNGKIPKDEFIQDKKVYRLMEGAFWLNKGANTERQIKVKPNCLNGDKHAEINTCQYKYHMRVDGKVRNSRYPHRVSKKSRDSDSALKEFATTDARDTCAKFLGSLKHDLTTFWFVELLNLTKMWTMVGNKALEDYNKVDQGAFNTGSKANEGDLVGLLSGKGLNCHVSCTSHEDEAQAAKRENSDNYHGYQAEKDEPEKKSSEVAVIDDQSTARSKRKVEEVENDVTDVRNAHAQDEDEDPFKGYLEDTATGKSFVCQVKC